MTEYFDTSFNCENIPMYKCNINRTDRKCIWSIPAATDSKCAIYTLNDCNKTNGRCMIKDGHSTEKKDGECINYDPNNCNSTNLENCQDIRYCRINEKFNKCENIPYKYLSLFTDYGGNYPKGPQYFNIFINLLIVGITFYLLNKHKISINIKTLLFIVIHLILDYTLF